MHRPYLSFLRHLPLLRRRMRASGPSVKRNPDRGSRPETPAAPLRRTAVLALVLVACGTVDAHSPREFAWSDAPREGLVGELARLRLERRIGPRLSISSPGSYVPCSLLPPPDSGTVPVTRCSPSKSSRSVSERIARISERASKAVRDSVDPDALHAAALIDLLWSDGAGNSLQRSISYLQSAARLTDRPGPVLADLSAALLVRAERMQTPRDLMEAVEVADSAVELEPQNRAARYNLALALDRSRLTGGAAREWRAFLAVDSTSGWADEGGRRLRARGQPTGLPRPLSRNASAAEAAAYAAAAPQQAHQLGLDSLLSEWGEAVLANDPARAEQRLDLAEALGEVLTKRGGDASLADAVHAIHAHAGDRAATFRLARAHRAYGSGREAYQSNDRASALRWFDSALAERPASEPLVAWSTVFRGATLVYEGSREEGEGILRDAVADADSMRHPALAGRARWMLGTTLLRSNRSAEALDMYRRAARLFAHAAEREHLGAVQALAAEAEISLGDAAEGFASTHRSLVTLRPYRSSVWLHNLLYVGAEAAADAGFFSMASRLADEDVAVAAGMRRPDYLAEAHLARARLLAAGGEVDRARADVHAGRSLVARLEPGPARTWFEADLRLAEAGAMMRADPRGAVAALDSVVAFFAAQGNPLGLLPALVRRAEALLSLGDEEAALADLDRVMTLVDKQRAEIARTRFGATLLDATREIFDQAVMLHVRAGRAEEALAYLERARASYLWTGSQPATSRPGAPLPALPGQVALEYALIGDTLLVWTVAEAGIRLTATTLPRAQLGRTIERARSALELRIDAATAREPLRMLYDWLVRPIEAQLGPEGTRLVVIADGEIAATPFAALYDARQGRYLVERHPLRFANSLRDTAWQRGEGGASAPGGLLVANPAFDPGAFPGLGRLKGAEEEARAVSREYPRSVLLSGRAANRAAIERAVREATVLHYAGHAVFDDERPERSFLVLAPGPGGSGRLSAEELERLDLRNIRLVVLSACHTLPARNERSGGFGGLSGALLAAGAGGVVGSLWRVDDRLTPPLIIEFHRAYRESGDGAGALRSAQLRLLRSSDPALRSPAAWAGFRYAGH